VCQLISYIKFLFVLVQLGAVVIVRTRISMKQNAIVRQLLFCLLLLLQTFVLKFKIVCSFVEAGIVLNLFLNF